MCNQLAGYGVSPLGNFSFYSGLYEEHTIQSHLSGEKGCQAQNNIDIHTLWLEEFELLAKLVHMILPTEDDKEVDPNSQSLSYSSVWPDAMSE